MADQLIAGIPPVLDANGDPVAGGSVTFYETGTTTLVPIYSDQAGTIALINPLPLDASGRTVQVFYTGAVAVRAVVKNAAGFEIDTVDPSPRFSVTASAASGVTFSPIGVNPATDVQAAIENVSSALAAFSDSPIATVGGGTANAISLASGKSLTSIPTGQRLAFFGALDNTAAMTVAVDGLPAVAIKAITGGATPAGYVRAGVLTEMFYDGTQWIADRIIQRGSNANGAFVRFADGTQICTHAISIPSITDPIGQLYRSAVTVWTFPAAFAANPTFSGSGGATNFWIAGASATTSASYRLLSPVSIATANTTELMAAGRWF